MLDTHNSHPIAYGAIHGVYNSDDSFLHSVKAEMDIFLRYSVNDNAKKIQPDGYKQA